MEEELTLKTTNVKRKTQRVTFTIRIDEPIYFGIKDFRQKNNISKSRAIRQLIEKGLKSG